MARCEDAARHAVLTAARAAARLVRRPRPRPAVAAPRPHALGRAGQRGDAAADAGRPRRPGVGGVARALARPRRPRGRLPRRGRAHVGSPRLPASRAAPARGRGGVRASGSPARCRRRTTTSGRCRAWATTPPPRCRRSPSAAARWCSTPTCAACSPGCSTAAALPRPSVTVAERAGAESVLPDDDASRGAVVGGGDGARRARVHGRLAGVRRVPGRGAVRVAGSRTSGVRRTGSTGAALRRHRPPGARPAAGGRARRARAGGQGVARRGLGRRRPARARPGLAGGRRPRSTPWPTAPSPSRAPSGVTSGRPRTLGGRHDKCRVWGTPWTRPH